MSENEANDKEMKEFIELLLQYSQDERKIDINRCFLSQNLYFDACSLYNYILFNFSENKNINKNVISFLALKNFIQVDLGINIENNILSKFFDFYSSQDIYGNDEERYLEYVEFVDIFYPRYNYQLRRFLQQRNGLNKNMKSLDNVTKVLLQKLFIREINMIKDIILSRNNNNIFESKKSANDIFNIISNNRKIITKQDLINFFNLYNNNIYFTEEDINSIIASLSLNRYNNDNKKGTIIEGISYETFTNIFTVKNNLASFTLSSNNNEFKIIEPQPKDKNAIFKSIIINTIKKEKKIEEAKIPLVGRGDFDINVLTSLLAQDKNKNKIEYDNFLKTFNISLNDLEKILFFRRIDLTKKGYLNKNELFDFFIPFDKEYREKISKDMNEKNHLEINNMSDISKGTKIYINNLFNIIIKGEKEINLQKMDLKEDKMFINNIFDEIVNIETDNNIQNSEEDILKYKDYFNKEQLYEYLTNKLNLAVSDYEFNLFFKRLDKLRRNKIQILEFTDEMKYIP